MSYQTRGKLYIRTVLVSLLISICSCSSSQDPIIRYEYYTPGYRPYGPEPTYSRLSWSHLPQPAPRPAGPSAPQISPIVFLDLPHSTFAEAIQAIAQTMGYECSYPQALKEREISLKHEGTVDELLLEIGNQAGVVIELDHEKRLIKVAGDGKLSGFTGSFSGRVIPAGLS